VPATPFPRPAATPFPAPAPTAPPTPPPTPEPTPEPTPAPTPPRDICEGVVFVNVINPELIGAVQSGIDLLNAHFGCQMFIANGSGVPVRFADITSALGAKVLGYAHSDGSTYEIWLNPECWGVIDDWGPIVAHELGHYLGWRHGDDHPYMWLPPPPGSYARPGDGALVCY
jgi:hypothetical protein